MTGTGSADTITFEDIGRNTINIWSFLYYTDAPAQIEAKQYAGRLLEAGMPAELIRKLAVVVRGRRVKVRAARKGEG